MPKIRRSLILTSLTLIIGAAVCLTLFYRHVTVQALTQDSEADNEILAHEFVRSHSPALANFLESVADDQSAQPRHSLPAPLATSIAQFLEQKHIKKIEIYNQAGNLVYSSDPNARGTDRASDAGVRAALAGNIANEFVFRDSFSRLDFATARDNFVQSYIPVRFPGDVRVIGVFELNVGVDELITLLERTELQFMLGGLIGFSLLTVALFVVFRRAGDVIESAQLAVENDKRNLSRASLRVLHSEETRSEKIATDLHGGVVQSLSAVKLLIENAIAKAAKGNLTANDPALDSLIPAIQEVIAALSSLAAELHPASLRELGLLPALSRVCDEFQRAHRSINVESAIQVTESQVPQHLKITIYRTVQTILDYVGRQSGHYVVETSLAVEQGGLQLRMDLGRSETEDDPSSSRAEPVGAQVGIERVHERIVLSGGAFSVHADTDDHVTLLAKWALDSEHVVATGA